VRIVLFTIENTEFVPTILDPILTERGHEIVKVFVSKAAYGVKFITRRLGFLARNGYPFCIRASDWWRIASQRVHGMFDRKDAPANIVEYVRERGVEADYIQEIRTEEARQRLRDLDADIFLFCPFDRIAGPKFLSIPRLGTFNLHLGKLPEYRGGLHAFWVLRSGDPQAGATVHQVTTELDAGDIVVEKRFPVETHCMQTLMAHTMGVCGPLMLRALDRVEEGAWEPVDTTGRAVGYHMLPTRKDFRAFYRRGCCIAALTQEAIPVQAAALTP
jgi:folate-dependent phosphoribosylglycinamide formyltransferase PurN